MRILFVILLTGCGLDSFTTDKADPDNPDGDSGFWALDSGYDGNRPPEAQAGIDQILFVDDVAVLDGGFSFDPDDDPLTYSWLLIDAPAGSSTQIAKANLSKAELYLDQIGVYELTLEVGDGVLFDTDTLIIEAKEANEIPVADAGSDQSVPTGSNVQLSGSKSFDPDEDPLYFEWRFKSKPNGSAASLVSTSSALTGFQADLEGRYLIELTVNDGFDDSNPDVVEVMASNDSSGGSSCSCGEIEQEIRSRPWLFGIAILPQNYLGPLLIGVWARRRKKSSESSES